MIFTDAALGDFLAGSINYITDTFRLYLVDNTAFTPPLDPHVSDLAPASIIASGLITGHAISGRTATCDVVSLSPVPSGKTVAGMWVARIGATDALSRLICFTDRNSDNTPISFATTGADMTVSFYPYLFSI